MVDEQYVFEAEVYLGELDPGDVRAELYAKGIAEDGPLCTLTRREQKSGGTGGRFVFTVSVPAVRPLADFTARLLPHHAGASVPLEAPHLLWQR